MAAAIAVTPSNPTAVVSACRIDVTGADLNDTTTYNTDHYPVDSEIRYYILCDNPSGDNGKSYAFAPGKDGKHTLANYIFPNPGSWTVRLRKVSDDSDVATQAVTVS